LPKQQLAQIGQKLDSIIGSPGLTAAARRELRILRSDISRVVENVNAREVVETLTKAEMDVLTQLAKGLSSKAIATELFLSVSTIKTHLAAIYLKLNVSSRSHAVRTAHTLGLISES
jgi:DNA-binding NarL/FixJ family response regulator